MNVFDYYVTKLGVKPNDPSLYDLPLNSPCGRDCKGVIDAAKRFLTYASNAYGSKSHIREQTLKNTFDIVEVFLRG